METIKKLMDIAQFFCSDILKEKVLKAINMFKAILVFLTEIAGILYAFDNAWKQKGI